MEGYPPNPLVPPGYINSEIPLFFPQPQVTHVLATPAQVYVSPNGSDDVNNVGSVTSPFASIGAALFYVTNVLDQPLATAVCIYISPGVYAGDFNVPDNVYLIGPSNSPAPVVITSAIFAVPQASSATIGFLNLTLQALTVSGFVYDANVEVTNCSLTTETVFSALTIAPDDTAINMNVTLSECVIRATDETNANLIFANATEKCTLTLNNCELVSEAVEGVMIDITGNLNISNSSLTNIAAGTTLFPLIVSKSGATLTPVVSLEGSVLKYADLQTDVVGNKLAIRFDAPTQPITARMTNCTLSIFLGGGATDIVKNIGAQNVTFTQSANSCLKDGKTIDATNMVLTAAYFLNDSPLPPGPGAGVATLNTLSGDITLEGASGISVGAAGSTITISGSGVTTLAGLTGAVTLSSPESTIAIAVDGQDITFESNGLLSATAGDGIEITGTQDLTIANTGVLSVAALTGAVTLSSPESTIAIAVDGQDITFESNGLLSATAGDGIEITGTQDLTIANTGVLSVAALTGAVTLTSPDESLTIAVDGNDIQLTVPAVEFPVTSVGGKTGAVTFAEGDGITLDYGATNADPITITNSGLLSATAGDGISVDTVDGVVTIDNTGVVLVNNVAGAVTLVSPDDSLTIAVDGNDIQLTVPAVEFPVTSVGGKTGAVTFAGGDGITLDYGATNADPITINTSVVGVATSGSVDQTGFSGPDPTYSQYYKAITVTGMFENGIVVATTSGTPGVCYSAWITTVIPTTDTLTFWVAGDPVAIGETWQAHYIVQSYGTAPPP